MHIERFVHGKTKCSQFEQFLSILEFVKALKVYTQKDYSIQYFKNATFCFDVKIRLYTQKQKLSQGQGRTISGYTLF